MDTSTSQNSDGSQKRRYAPNSHEARLEEENLRREAAAEEKAKAEAAEALRLKKGVKTEMIQLRAPITVEQRKPKS